MKSKTAKAIEVTLVLNEPEARWLKELIQIASKHPDMEINQNLEMRQRFWEALENVEL